MTKRVSANGARPPDDKDDASGAAELPAFSMFRQGLDYWARMIDASCIVTQGYVHNSVGKNPLESPVPDIVRQYLTKLALPADFAPVESVAPVVPVVWEDEAAAESPAATTAELAAEASPLTPEADAPAPLPEAPAPEVHSSDEPVTSRAPTRPAPVLPTVLVPIAAAPAVAAEDIDPDVADQVPAPVAAPPPRHATKSPDAKSPAAMSPADFISSSMIPASDEFAASSAAVTTAMNEAASAKLADHGKLPLPTQEPREELRRNGRSMPPLRYESDHGGPLN